MHHEVTDSPLWTPTRVSSWAMNRTATMAVARPSTPEEIPEILRRAREAGLTVGVRGTGCSYGDAALNAGGLLLDTSGARRILDFDRESGILVAEPGVTIEQIWRHTLPHGWWPAVVPGTMKPTLAGCLAMNVHGKNNFRASTVGQHVLSFDLMLADGSVRRCSRTENADLFFTAIGGLGLLGVFTRVVWQLHRVQSGDLRVSAFDHDSIDAMVEHFEARHASADYLVGWIDGFGGGRGLTHQAEYLRAGEDPDPAGSLSARHQDLPPRFFLVVPKSWLWLGLWGFLHNPGMRLVNAVKYRSGRREARQGAHRQSLVGFSFLLDYVPGWKRAYAPGGFVQYQTFVPKAQAAKTFNRQLALCRELGPMPYLCVLKKHQPDPFVLTHAVDGYSLALDLPLRRGRWEQVLRLAKAMNEVVIEAGGRFYAAKDSVLGPDGFSRAYPEPAVAEFRRVKARWDPEALFQSELARRWGLVSPR